MAGKVSEELGEIRARLDTVDGTLGDFHTLLSNHMTDYATKFGRLKASVETSIITAKEVNDARDKALHTEIGAYKWVLIAIGSLTAISLAGFVTLCIRLIGILIGG